MEVLHAHAAVVAVGRLRPPRPAVAARVGGQRAIHVGGDLFHRRRIEPAAQVEEAGFGEKVRDVGVVVVGSERAVQVERVTVAVAEVDRPARVHAARPSISERSTTHQSRKSPRLPRTMSSVPPVKNVIGVLRSLTTSATSASESRTSPAPPSPSRSDRRPSSSCIVHEPCGVVNVNGSTPSSSAPRAARSWCASSSAGSCSSKN